MGSQWQDEHGLTLIELMIVIAIIGILVGAAAPSVKEWSRNYQSKRAAMDLYAHMQAAKTGARRQNQPWTINFAPTGFTGYEVRHGVDEDGDGQMDVVREVDFAEKYGNSIQYGHPTSTDLYDQPIVTFHHSGLTIDPTQRGFTYMKDSTNVKYYRIGVPFISGLVRVEKWNGSSWE